MRLWTVLAIPLLAVSQALAGEAAPALKTEDEKVLYALGAALGKNIAMLELTAAQVKYAGMGFKDSVLRQKPQVDMSVYGPKVNEFYSSRVKAGVAARKNKEKAFLDNAAKEKGAQVLASGLVYTGLKAGTGPSPSPTDTVRVHYRGTLTTGATFDSSYDRGQPADLPLNHVIPCWTEGIPKLKVGGKARFVCPSSIGYGDSGSGPIPGGATLVFEVELLDIVKQP